MSDDSRWTSKDSAGQAIATHMLFDALVAFLIRRGVMTAEDFNGMIKQALAAMDASPSLPPVLQNAYEKLANDLGHQSDPELH